MKTLLINPQDEQAPTRDRQHDDDLPVALPNAQRTLQHPSRPGEENASIFFVGTATTIL